MGFEPGFSVAAPATCPVALRARIRLCRLPTGSPRRWRRREDQVRDIGLDVHRDFCEVAIAEEGELRSAGRIETTPERLELFAQSLDGLWLPDERTGALRRRLGRRAQLVRARTRAKNEVHAALVRRLITKPKVA